MYWNANARARHVREHYFVVMIKKPEIYVQDIRMPPARPRLLCCAGQSRTARNTSSMGFFWSRQLAHSSSCVLLESESGATMCASMCVCACVVRVCVRVCACGLPEATAAAATCSQLVSDSVDRVDIASELLADPMNLHGGSEQRRFPRQPQMRVSTTGTALRRGRPHIALKDVLDDEVEALACMGQSLRRGARAVGFVARCQTRARSVARWKMILVRSIAPPHCVTLMWRTSSTQWHLYACVFVHGTSVEAAHK